MIAGFIFFLGRQHGERLQTEIRKVDNEVTVRGSKRRKKRKTEEQEGEEDVGDLEIHVRRVAALRHTTE